MKRLLLFIPLLLVCLGTSGSPAESKGLLTKWDKNDIQDLLNDVKTVLTKTGNIRKDVQKTIKQMIKGRDGMGPEAQQLLVRHVLPQVKQLAISEMTEIKAFLGSEDERELRTKLKTVALALQGALQDILKTVADLVPSCSESSAPVPDFSPLINQLDSVPGLVLYPVHRALQIAPGLLSFLCDHLACLQDVLALLGDVFSYANADDLEQERIEIDITEEPGVFVKGAAKMAVIGQVLASAGGSLATQAEQNDPKAKVAIWGWIGVNVSPQVAGKIGALLKLVGKLVELAAGQAASLIARVETNMFRAQVLANQQALLDG